MKLKPPNEATTSATSLAFYRCPGVVYFFGAGKNPLIAIKIGMTALTKAKGTLQSCIRQRHEQIQSSNHETIELLGVIRFSDGEYPAWLAEDCEHKLHIQFAARQRFKPHTRGAEWFTPADDILNFIRENTEAPETLSIPRVIGLPINR